jgi:hypothetical protein
MFSRARFAAFLLLLTAVPAGAQTADPDTSTITLGPFGINPSLQLRDIGRDTNVFNERDNPKSDFTMTIVPRFEVVVRPKAMRLTVNTATEYVYYQTYESERSINRSAGVRADFLLARIQPYVLASGTSTTARLNAEVDERARHNDRVYGAGVDVKAGTRTTFGALYRTSRIRYDEGEEFRGQNLAESFDSDIDLIEGSAGVELTPFTRLSVRVSHEEERFALSPDRDADSTRITPTLSFSPDAVIRGSASIGYRRFTPKSSTLPGYGGLVASATLATTVFDRNHIDLTLGRDLRYSYDQATPYYLATGGTATLTTELVGPFDVRGTGQYQFMDYRGHTSTSGEQGPGDDTLTSYGGGFGYRIRERLRIGINADWTERTSELSDDRGYTARRIYASLTWGTQR